MDAAENTSRVDSRDAALTAYLDRESANGFRVETRSATQAIIVRGRRGFGLLRGHRAERRVLSVDEDGHVTARIAEPVRW